MAHSSSSLLLGFSTDNFNSDLRLHSRRTGYAFCPLCLAGQSVVHVPWEWAFVYLRHCSIHGKQLRSDCMSCGTQDPLPSASYQQRAISRVTGAGRTCWRSLILGITLLHYLLSRLKKRIGTR